MTFSRRLTSRAWLIVPALALFFLAWSHFARFEHVRLTTQLAQELPRIDPASSTGYAGGMRELIVPEGNPQSYEWIAQTQQMFARHEGRVRWIDYENAPFGHAVNSASLYRWWLGAIASADHWFSHRPIGVCVERAALLADPVLQLFFFLGTVCFVAGRFGRFPAAVFSVGLVALFPLAGDFLSGAPDDHGLAWICGFWSLLLLLAGVEAAHHGQPVREDLPTATEAGSPTVRSSVARWFSLAGVVGGLGLWVSVGIEVPLLAGVLLGGLVTAWIRRSATAQPWGGALPWRAWAAAGATTTLVLYLVEYFPHHLGSWQLRAIHPLYGLAWLGAGELLAQATSVIGDKIRPRLRQLAITVLALAAIAALPVAIKKTGNLGFLAPDLSSLRLTKLPDGVVASNFKAWILRDWFTTVVWATLLPLLLVLPAFWLLWRRSAAVAPRIMMALALGPLALAAAFAFRQLAWWNVFDSTWLVLLVAALAAKSPTGRPRVTAWFWCIFVAVMVAPGLWLLRPPKTGPANNVVSQLELEGLIERDLAHWLDGHSMPGAVVLATPNQTATLYYYGGLRGVGTFSDENRDGFAAALRIASATTTEEALALIRRREVTHIVVSSWDGYLDEYARLGLGQVDGSFVDRLHKWALPPWLRPMAYQLPSMAGLEAQTVQIFEVVDEQDDPLKFSRIADYFVEMGQLDAAASVEQALRRYPADVRALTARANVQLARNELTEFNQTLATLLGRLAKKADRSLPWDRRTSLAVVLARGKRGDLARKEIERCLAEIDETKLRELSVGSLYRLQVLMKAFSLSIADPRLRDLSLELLPAEWRSRI